MDRKDQPVAEAVITAGAFGAAQDQAAELHFVDGESVVLEQADYGLAGALGVAEGELEAGLGTDAAAGEVAAGLGARRAGERAGKMLRGQVVDFQQARAAAGLVVGEVVALR